LFRWLDSLIDMGNRNDKASTGDVGGDGDDDSIVGEASGVGRGNGRSNRQDKSEKVGKVSYWQLVRGGYNDLVNAIIRPPRAEYDMGVLGPEVFTVDGRVFTRQDIELVNKRGLKLACSHWKPKDQTGAKPCMVYLHGNASCRAEALECLPLILSSGLTLFALDFAGSGMSEGEYISLGWFEREDVQVVVEHLRNSDMVSTIGLWGRSMGAVTALMFGDSDPTIACMILDSPFASLRQLAKELVDHAQLSVPRVAVGLALKMVRSSVKSRAGFDINKIDPIKNADKSFIPALFGAAEGDKFIRPHHSQQIYEKYAGDKNIIEFEGDHNSSRTDFFMASVGIFLHNTMLVPCDQGEGAEPKVTDEQELLRQLYNNFEENNYSMPAPLSPSGAGIGINVGVQGGGGDGEDFYEEAMFRYAVELSLAESESGPQVTDQTPAPAPTTCPPPLPPTETESTENEIKPPLLLPEQSEQSLESVSELRDELGDDTVTSSCTPPRSGLDLAPPDGEAKPAPGERAQSPKTTDELVAPSVVPEQQTDTTVTPKTEAALDVANGVVEHGHRDKAYSRVRPPAPSKPRPPPPDEST